jgi:amino acid transporter
VFGIVFNASHGMVPLVYVIGLIAMVFTALSYMSMSKAFPVAGSVYAYAARSLGPVAGFFSGWAILLDYLLIPSLTYVVSAIALQAVYPAFSKAACVVVMVIVATVLNVLGIETTARAAFVLLGLQVVFLIVFCCAGIVALGHHLGGAHVSLLPLYNPAEISPALVFGALSIAVLSFLGFDAISTLAEESRGGSRAIGRATMLSLVISALLFVVQTWIASLFVLGQTHLAPGSATDDAFYTISAHIGGPAMEWALAVPGIFLSSLAGAVTAQAATARLLFGMARDGELPRALAYVDPARRVPVRAVYLVAAVTLAIGIFMVDQLELLTSMVSFGALLGFLMLQVCVVAHFVWREKSRNWFRHLISPAIAFAIIAYVLINADNNAKIAGICWMLAGAAIYITLKRLNRPTTLPD